jgi:hypothetical protein
MIYAHKFGGRSQPGPAGGGVRNDIYDHAILIQYQAD